MSIRLPQELIDEIVQNTDLVALVRASGVELKGSGSQLMGLCPFHEDKRPSLSVNPQKGVVVG